MTLPSPHPWHPLPTPKKQIKVIRETKQNMKRKNNKKFDYKNVLMILI